MIQYFWCNVGSEYVIMREGEVVGYAKEEKTILRYYRTAVHNPRLGD